MTARRCCRARRSGRPATGRSAAFSLRSRSSSAASTISTSRKALRLLSMPTPPACPAARARPHGQRPCPCRWTIGSARAPCRRPRGKPSAKASRSRAARPPAVFSAWSTKGWASRDAAELQKDERAMLRRQGGQAGCRTHRRRALRAPAPVARVPPRPTPGRTAHEAEIPCFRACSRSRAKARPPSFGAKRIGNLQQPGLDRRLGRSASPSNQPQRQLHVAGADRLRQGLLA